MHLFWLPLQDFQLALKSQYQFSVGPSCDRSIKAFRHVFKMILFIVFFALLAYLVYKSTRKPERFPPGPPKLPIVGSLPYLENATSFAHMMIGAAKKYGPVSGIFLGRQPTVIIADYTILKGNSL